MPTMPAWAEGARIIYDTEHPFAFIRRGRRAVWTPYLVKGHNLIKSTVDGRSKLDKAREDVLAKIGESITNMVMALHPHADKTHLRVAAHYVGDKYLSTGHACGINYGHYKTVETIEQVTCPVCVAVVMEDMASRLKALGPGAVAEARQHVRDVRAFNALGHVVDGEDATNKL